MNFRQNMNRFPGTARIFPRAAQFLHAKSGTEGITKTFWLNSSSMQTALGEAQTPSGRRKLDTQLVSEYVTPEQQHSVRDEEQHMNPVVKR